MKTKHMYQVAAEGHEEHYQNGDIRQMEGSVRFYLAMGTIHCNAQLEDTPVELRPAVTRLHAHALLGRPANLVFDMSEIADGLRRLEIITDVEKGGLLLGIEHQPTSYRIEKFFSAIRWFAHVWGELPSTVFVWAIDDRRDYHITCRRCNTQHTVKAGISDVQKWMEGELIQRALPHLKPAERELLQSQTCGKCFDEIFPPEEDEHEEEMR